MKNSNQITVAVVLLVILTGGIFLAYDYKKNKEKSILASLGFKSSSLPGTATIEPDTGVNSPAAKAYTDATSNASIPPITELRNPSSNDFVTLTPHWRGIWRSGTNDSIIERYSGKIYKKDKPLEIYGANKKWKMYYVKYYDDMCYFPVDLISEEGVWK